MISNHQALNAIKSASFANGRVVVSTGKCIGEGWQIYLNGKQLFQERTRKTVIVGFMTTKLIKEEQLNVTIRFMKVKELLKNKLKNRRSNVDDYFKKREKRILGMSKEEHPYKALFQIEIKELKN